LKGRPVARDAIDCVAVRTNHMDRIGHAGLRYASPRLRISM
jgi:hypothetical protein